MKEKEKFMNEKELKNQKKQNKKFAKRLIDKSDNFILFTEDDSIGGASVGKICEMLILGLRAMKGEVITKTLMQEICDVVMADNIEDYLKESEE
jgi:hypothetical protein